jgi:predicted outer membrane protein
LPQSDNREALLAAVESALYELETLCVRLERGLMRRQWSDIDAAIADSRRITHALQNAMEDAASVRDREFDQRVMRRLSHVHAIRQNQMERLQQYQDAVSQRLQLIARWKGAVKSISRRGTRARVTALNQLT